MSVFFYLRERESCGKAAEQGETESAEGGSATKRQADSGEALTGEAVAAPKPTAGAA